MSKTLSNILTVFKVLKVIAKVVFILCIVGGVGCALGLIMMPIAESLFPEGLPGDEGDLITMGYAGCIIGAIACVGEAIFAFMTERYFGRILRAGTPFTMEGSRECFRLGIVSIIISIATSVIGGFVSFIAVIVIGDTLAPEFGMTASLSPGLFFLFLSLVFKHGAEVQVPTDVYIASTAEGGLDAEGNGGANQEGYYDSNQTELL